MKFKRLSACAGAVACFTAACAMLGATVAKASPYLVTIEQVGTDVIATGSGQIDLTGLTLSGDCSCSFAYIYPSSGAIQISDGFQFANLWGSAAFSGPSSFGSGGFTVANNRSGSQVGVLRNWVLVPFQYISDSDLGTSTSTYLSTTFASLGVTPGTYIWTWGTGADQRFTLQIGETPLPAALPLFASGLGALGLLGWRRKRKAQVAA